MKKNKQTTNNTQPLKNKKAYKLYQQGKHHAAELSLNQSIKKANKANSQSDFDLNLLGVIHYLSQRYDSAITLLTAAIRLNSNDPNYYNNLGAVYKDTNEAILAINAFTQAVILNPSHVEALYNIGSTYQMMGDFDKAEAFLLEALTHNPDFTIARNNLACIYLDRGKTEDAIYVFDSIIAKEPNNYAIKSNRLFSMNYLELPDDFLFNEHLEYGNKVKCERPIHKQSRPNKKIRIGYVSPDFRLHSVSYFLYPIIKFHNTDHFEVYCYSDVITEDAVTLLYKQHSTNYLNTLPLSDILLFNQIQADNIDILIDCAGHSARNRLPVFAMKPSAYQVSYIGYPNTTGLQNMDYRFTDHFTDPPSNPSSQLYTERLIYLDDIFLSYYPGYKPADTTPPPSSINGYTTYGSFNNRSKVNTHTLNSWASILLNDPTSRLLLKSSINSDEFLKNSILNEFEIRNIDSSRISISPYLSFQEHLSLYQKIDIALDTYPYNGTTTTCEALWSGVPVITQCGYSHRSRVSADILTSTRLTACIANTQEEYIAKAISLSHNQNFLNMWRAKHKTQMEQSSLMNYSSLVKNIEDVYTRIHNGEL